MYGGSLTMPECLLSGGGGGGGDMAGGFRDAQSFVPPEGKCGQRCLEAAFLSPQGSKHMERIIKICENENGGVIHCSQSHYSSRFGK